MENFGPKYPFTNLQNYQRFKILPFFALISLIIYLFFPLKLTVVYEDEIMFMKKFQDIKLLNVKSRVTNKGLHYKIVYYDHKPDWVPTSVFRSCSHVCKLSASGMESADAVVFNNNNLLYRKGPPDKPPAQIWIFHSKEPLTMIHSFRQWKRLFNWTMSYRRDSDVFDSFAKFVKKGKGSENGLTVEKSVQTWKNKTKNISWLVSNCQYASSKRMDYVIGMKRYMNVDVMGKCGRLEKTCTNFRNWRYCIEPYKYYLAFENSLCRDYITEKAFRMYSNNLSTIPITRGTPQESIFLPPMSFLSTSDFPDPYLMAKYLQKLEQDDENIRALFQWKNIFSVQESTGFCELCRRLHNSDKYRGVYGDIDKWIKMTGQCHPAKDLNT